MGELSGGDPAPWSVERVSPVAECRVFRVNLESCVREGDGLRGDFYTVQLRDWVVALGVTPEDDLLLVRQWRFGVKQHTWELPAGVIDPGEDPLAAGRRELQEETGFDGGEARLLGWTYPNPALQDNRCFFVYFEGLAPMDEPPGTDLHEEIQVCRLAVQDAFREAARGGLHHAIALTALFYLRAFREGDIPEIPSG